MENHTQTGIDLSIVKPQPILGYDVQNWIWPRTYNLLKSSTNIS